MKPPYNNPTRPAICNGTKPLIHKSCQYRTSNTPASGLIESESTFVGRVKSGQPTFKATSR